MKPKYTPMMMQYFEIKEQHKNEILMYRLGDFYEMFFDDAIIASKVLDIALTGRDCGMEEKAPMCGIPFHSSDSYIAKLIENGYNVAICEQVEDPKNAKGIVKREVIRTVTPGTMIDPSALDDGKNNYLCSIFVDKKGYGISFADITTGEISMFDYPNENTDISILSSIAKFVPSEVIINKKGYDRSVLIDTISSKYKAAVKNYADSAFDLTEALKRIESQFPQNSSLAIASEKERGVRSLGALLQYLESTQKTHIDNLQKVSTEQENLYMQIDAYSIRNLELLETMRDKKAKGSLLHILNKTKTSMGSRLLRKWITTPLLNCIKIQNRHNAVSELLKKPIIREELIENLKNVQDIERLMAKVSFKTANGKDLLSIANSVSVFPRIKELLSECDSSVFLSIIDKFDVLDDICQLITYSISDEAPFSIREGGIINDGYNRELDDYRAVKKNGVNWINDIVEEEKKKTGIKNIKSGYNRVFGYYLEISKVNAHLAPDYFIRKQTLANCERYVTPQIKEIEEKIVEAESKLVDLEYDIFCNIRDTIASHMVRIQNSAHIVAMIDVLCSFAVVAEKNNYVMPEVNMSDSIIIRDGRHPVVESLNNSDIFIPNDVHLDTKDNQINIITGPNMAGKSTYMRQTAIITLMAQIGSFVPASYASIGIVDKIFTRVGASDDLTAGQSTFMVEMSEVAYILENATKNSLIILDEIGRGTSTYDGLSIAWAVVEYISDKKKCGAKTLFATHYHELTELENTIKSVKNYCIAVKKNGDDITFLRKIIRGGADDSYGIEVAALAGVKKAVIKRAKEILSSIENNDSNKNNSDILNADNGISDDLNQMDFLSFADNEVVSELKQMDLNVITPMEALTKLYALQAKAKNM